MAVNPKNKKNYVSYVNSTRKKYIKKKRLWKILKNKKKISHLKGKLIKHTLEDQEESVSKVSLPNYKLKIYNIFYHQYIYFIYKFSVLVRTKTFLNFYLTMNAFTKFYME